MTIGMAAGAESPSDYLAIAAGIALVVLVSWGILRSARAVKATDERFLGAIVGALERLRAP